MEWVEINIETPDDIARDAIVNRLFELGAEGVDEGDRTCVKGFFKPHLKDSVERELNAFVAALTDLNPGLPAAKLKVKQFAEENWADEYKKFYLAQPFSKHFYLLPAWDKQTKLPDGKQALIMDPGRAFGTGIHASTQLCAGLFEQALERLPAPETLRVLDLGTGTGILAMVAKKLGVNDVVAIDNDPEAVEVAAENLILNQCEGIDLSTRDVATEKKQFDVILSNILLETHRELVGVYRRLLKPAGFLIVSGLLGNQRNEMDECFAQHGLVPEASASLQEWTSVTYFLRSDWRRN